MSRAWNITPRRRIFFSSLSIIPFPPSLCSQNCALGATKCTKHYQVQSTFSKNALQYVSKKHFFSQGEKNINKKLIHSLTSCIRKLNQNKTENPMFKSKEKTTAADFCKSIFSVHTNCSTTEKETKIPHNPLSQWI